MRRRKILILVGHPDRNRLTTHFADAYEAGAKEAGHEVFRLELSSLTFDPILHRGYEEKQDLEPDLHNVQEKIKWCDHFVIFYPSWWSSMPALLKGMFERLWLPGFAFHFHKSGWWWNGLLKGRSATVFVLSDSPPLFARMLFGDSTNEIRRGILCFAGFRPVRVKKIGPLKDISAVRVKRYWHRFKRWGRAAC
ncbi:MAG: NAD(P)H-dependent oxidoreductase [bacterium]|nr:NAD(P)H-dependent oxidoreductase [bacterium]